jgi:hypothetical protein
MALATAYLRRTDQNRPEIEDRARRHLRAGAARLARFEVPGEPGGYSLFGRAPARVDLTAYALMVFQDLEKVHPVDFQTTYRIVEFLRKQQREDGSWDDGKRPVFAATAFIAWALACDGHPTPRARAWLAQRVAEVDDPYPLALAALAFLADDARSETGRALAGRLAGLAEDAAWAPGRETLMGARGSSAHVETTALAIQALLRAGTHPGLVQRALDRLVGWRKRDGAFGTTQATSQAIKALLGGAPGAGARPARVRVGAGEADLAEAKLEANELEPVRLDLGERDPRGLEVQLAGERTLRGTLSLTTWEPWNGPHGGKGRVALDMRYPEGELAVGTRAYIDVTVRNPSAAPAKLVTAEVGLPPGCEVRHEAVEGREQALRVERGETRVVLYLDTLAPGATLRFRIPFTPRYGLDVATAPSKAYEYYTPEEGVALPPARVRAR